MPSLDTLPLVFTTTPQFIVADEEEIEDKKAKKKRLEMCGKAWLTYLNVYTGDLKHGLYECGLWREGCPICLAKRAKKYQNRVDKILQGGDVIEWALMSAQEAARIIAEEGKEKCQRFPKSKEMSWLLVANPSQHIGEVLTDSSSINWLEICNTPKGMNVSGNLGKVVASSSKEGFASILIEMIQHDGTPEMEYQAFGSAKEETFDLNPKTAEEAQVAFSRRFLMFKKHLRRIGVNITFSCNKRISFIVEQLNWRIEP